jgi:hypothetical protein
MIYFVQGETTRLIKIGYAACPRRRLIDLQVGSPDKLQILGIIDTTGRDKAYHEIFKHLLIRGEWFAPGKELLDYIRANCDSIQVHECSQCHRQPIVRRRMFPFCPEHVAELEKIAVGVVMCACGKEKKDYQRMCEACFKARREQS